MIPESASRPGPVAKGETVYGDGASTCDGGSTDGSDHSPLHGGHGVIADKVRALANNVYREFEVLIDSYGRDVVSNLMPPVVACLENLDHLYAEKTDLEVEIDLLKEDNQQLLGQFERERAQRKTTEEKILEIEDRHEEDRNALTTKVEGLELNVKMAEMKAKSAQDHVSRLEDKEVEMKKENARLHERYNDLLRSHLEVVERGKMASNSDVEAGSVSSGGPLGRNLHHHHHHHHLVVGRSRDAKDKPDGPTKKDNEDFFEEDDEPAPEESYSDNELNSWEQARDLGAFEPDSAMFEEMAMPDENEVQSDDEEGRPDVLDDADSESEFGMSKEIDKLINENMELIETKNALNIVKDDLINQVDDLTGENEMLREENNMMRDAKVQLKQRVRALETDLKETRQALETAREKIRELGEEEEEPTDGEAGVNPTHKRRFTRAEMVRLLTERNQFKERLMELQEAVRWTEMMRARRDHPELVTENGSGNTSSRRGMWKYFSGLFGGSVVGDVARRTPPRSVSSNAIAAASPAESGSGVSSSSSGSGPLAAIASFLSPSPSSPVAGNPLFMSPQSAVGPPRPPADIPKLIPHDVRLVPMPRGGPGAAVKRQTDDAVQR